MDGRPNRRKKEVFLQGDKPLFGVDLFPVFYHFCIP